MAVKGPAPMPAPAVYNWTGWYVGVNAGASFGDVKTDFNVPSTSLSACTALCLTFSESLSTPGLSPTNRTYPNGFMGGGQIGYNWQFSPIWVGGLEADFQGAVEKDHSGPVTTPFTATGFSCGIICIIPTPVSASGSTVADYQTKIDWFGTVRVRLGYVWGNGNVMSYLTGGLAYGKVGINETLTTAVTGFPSVTQDFSDSKVNTGWVVGYGTEGVIDFWGARNWTWKIEGLYMDRGHLDATAPGASATTCVISCAISFASTTAGPISTHSHFTDGILRGGLNYKFF